MPLTCLLSYACAALVCLCSVCLCAAGKQQQQLFEDGSDDDNADLGIGSDDDFGVGGGSSSEGGEGGSDSDGSGMSEDDDDQLAIEKHNKLLEKARWVGGDDVFWGDGWWDTAWNSYGVLHRVCLCNGVFAQNEVGQ